MLDLNRTRTYTLEELAVIQNFDVEGVKNYMQDKPLKCKMELYSKVTGEACSEWTAWSFYRVKSSYEASLEYSKVARKQMLLGKISEEGNLMGTVGEIAVAFTGADFLQDLRDLGYDIWNIEEEEIGGWDIVIDGVGLIPIVGILGKTDEILVLFKRSDNLFELAHINRLTELLELDGVLYLKKGFHTINTAGSGISLFGQDLYKKLLNSCNRYSPFKTGYSNPILAGLQNCSEDVKYLDEFAPGTLEEIISDIGRQPGKTAEEVKEMTREAVEQARKVVEGGSKTYTVDPSMQAKDIEMGVLIDEAYIKNPTAQNMSDLIKTGSNYVGNSKMNGQFMYVVDTNGNIVIGSRAGQHMPHPTLIGGTNPTVQGAGIVEIRGGKIYSIDNASGHFKPDSSCMTSVQNAFGQLPSNVFHKDFQGYSTVGD